MGIEISFVVVFCFGFNGSCVRYVYAAFLLHIVIV